jgi:hypothetical protein
MLLRDKLLIYAENYPKCILYYLENQQLGSLSRGSKAKTKITNMDFRTNLITDDGQFIVNEVEELTKHIGTFKSHI